MLEKQKKGGGGLVGKGKEERGKGFLEKGREGGGFVGGWINMPGNEGFGKYEAVSI